MSAFEIGHEYEATEPSMSHIKIIGRTRNFINVENDFGNQFRMKIRTDDDGDEYAYDSSVGAAWREAATYKAIWDVT